VDYKKCAKEFFIIAKLLTYPTDELKDELKNIIDDSDFKNNDTIKSILNYLSNNEIIETLQAEYTRLFVTGYPKTPCPPYFSAYQTGLIVSEHTDKLYNLYEEYGVELSNEQFPDFIPTMLEFMTLFLTNEMYDEAKKFHKEYLSWLVEFADNIRRNTKEQYFLKIAELLKITIKKVNNIFKED